MGEKDRVTVTLDLRPQGRTPIRSAALGQLLFDLRDSGILGVGASVTVFVGPEKGTQRSATVSFEVEDAAAYEGLNMFVTCTKKSPSKKKS